MANGRAAIQSQAGDENTPGNACPAFAFNLCCALKPDAKHIASNLQAEDIEAPARHAIWRAGETVDGVPVICRGWAVSAITLSDGRRQILSILLPGDLVSASFLFDPISHNSIEAVTDVRYRLFKRAGIQAAIEQEPAFFATLSELWANESARADQLVVDLGQRSADERIAGLILHLANRLAQRGPILNRTMEFPLRQHHIADATGLTSVHAGRVLSDFRRAGLIELSDRSLTVTKPDELRRIAGIH